MACGVLGFEGLSPRPIWTLPASAQHIPGLASFCRLFSPVPRRQSRVERSGPEEGNNLPVCVLYGSWNFWNYCLPARRRKKKIPFCSRTGCCSTFETAAVTSLAVGFGQGTDYPVVMVTANRKCPQQVKPGALFRGLRGLFSPRRGSFVPNRARKSSAEPRPPFRLAPLCDLLTVYCAKSPW